MCSKNTFLRNYLYACLIVILLAGKGLAEHTLNGPYTGKNLDHIAFPLGGIGAGCYCLEGTGSIGKMSIRHAMDYFQEPDCFAAVCIKQKGGNMARVLEGPVPDWKIFERPGAGLGLPGRTYGFPRFTEAEFLPRFPFADCTLTDPAVPLAVTLTGWSPFIPQDADRSSLPAGLLEYTLKNTGTEPYDAVFSFHSRNFLAADSVIEPISNGFRLTAPDAAFSISAPFESNVSVDSCWFRGSWWDALTVTWCNIEQGLSVSNPPDGQPAPGASFYLPISLKPGESRTVRLVTTWYVPASTLRIGDTSTPKPLPNQPAAGTAPSQQPVSGFHGEKLVNTFYPSGDEQVGTIYSPEFEIDRPYLRFLIGGGQEENVGVSLLVDGKPVLTAHGNNLEKLFPVEWPLTPWLGKKGQIKIFDRSTTGWGHINADAFVLTDAGKEEYQAALTAPDGLAKIGTFCADFESDRWENWTLETPDIPANTENTSDTYAPWYAAHFDSAQTIHQAVIDQYETLRADSLLFAEQLAALPVPPEILEAVSANLTILKSPTLLRQSDGRLWGWEGCEDNRGSCAGTCTHVWNYAQTLARLFPDLERTLRQTEFHESLTEEGRMAFRANLPIRPGGVAWDASDGLLGCVMKVHREWKLSGDDAWLAQYWPRVKRTMEWAIRTWDPNETGLLEQSHHNTYDINYLGPEGHCGSFYLGALAASAKMARAMGEDAHRWENLLERGRRRMETELFNGQWFVQIVPTPGKEGRPEIQSDYYKSVAETIDAQGPKYQYGSGCLSDGVLGFWMAKCCGIEEDIVSPEMIESHLMSVYRYNLVRNLSGHANPQRPGYALGNEGGLLLCTWPNHDKPILPFVYSDEVWTGIEYQVASHLIGIGRVEEGCEIVRICRSRYDGTRRNPFDEYECGHWYARAMASFALLFPYEKKEGRPFF